MRVQSQCYRLAEKWALNEVAQEYATLVVGQVESKHYFEKQSVYS